MAVINTDYHMLEMFDAIDCRSFMLTILLRIQYAIILFDQFCRCFLNFFIYAKSVIHVRKKFSLRNLCSGLDICFSALNFPFKFERYMC